MTAAEFKQHVLPLHRQLFALAFRMTGRVEDAEDIVQDAYLKLWDQRNKLSTEAATEPYCRAVVRHLCIDRLRLPGPMMVDEKEWKEEESVSSSLENRDEANLAIKLMERLPSQQQLVMKLHDVEGCTYGETAEALGMTEGNVRVLLSRARKRIRELFNKR